jgi:hypothetical protein
MLGSPTPPDRDTTCNSAVPHVAFRSPNFVGIRNVISELNTQPVGSPVNASRPPSPTGSRMTRGQCGSLHLHRMGLAPTIPCRSPGALEVDKFTNESMSKRRRGFQF